MIAKYKTNEVEIIFNEGLLPDVSRHLNLDKRHIVITDTNVYRYYQAELKTFSDTIIQIKPGEKSKNMLTFFQITKKLIRLQVTRDDVLVAVGGGVVGDLVGFIAATYKRGLTYIQIPSTLIAQVDSAIGGKVGINIGRYKNQMGLIYHPQKILIVPSLLSTLKPQEFVSGLGEVVKYAALFDADMFASLEKNDFILDDMIHKCIAYKIDVTTQDENDQGPRQLLNFGHTLGHAIEAKYHLPHGISIAYGMILESKNERLKALLYKLALCEDKEFVGLRPYVMQDKKRKNKQITKIELIDIGQAVLKESDIDEYFQP